MSRGEQADDDELDELHHTAGKQVSRRARHKSDLRAAGPLRTKPSDASDEGRLTQLQAILETLPKNSAYAKHRLAVVKKAISLLQLKREERSAADAAELDSLLKTLKLK